MQTQADIRTKGGMMTPPNHPFAGRRGGSRCLSLSQRETQTDKLTCGQRGRHVGPTPSLSPLAGEGGCFDLCLFFSQSDRDTEIMAETEREGERERERGRGRENQLNRQPDKQTDTQTDQQTYGQRRGMMDSLPCSDLPFRALRCSALPCEAV